MKKTAEGDGLKDDLSNYDDTKYKKPSVTVDIIICTILNGKLHVLLIKRRDPPFRGRWAIPGGFLQVEANETLETAAARELKEETNLENIFIEQLKTYGDPGRDPRTRVVTVAYYALIPYNMVKDMVRAGDDAAEAKWFQFPLYEKLAFDHNKILTDALLRIRGKIVYTPIAFNLVPKEFTWAELQATYEAILGTEIPPTNFARWIKSRHIISETGLRQKRKSGTGRPRALLEYRGERSTI